MVAACARALDSVLECATTHKWRVQMGRMSLNILLLLLWARHDRWLLVADIVAAPNPQPAALLWPLALSPRTHQSQASSLLSFMYTQNVVGLGCLREVHKIYDVVNAAAAVSFVWER